MGLQQAIYDAFLQVTNQFHKAVLALSGGRLMNTVSGMPVVELHTTGRNSGRRRSVMLTAPVYEPTRVVLVASKGGDDRDPEWYRNLVANPDVELAVHSTTRPMRARTATDEERAELWPEIIKAYRGYDAYQRRTDRHIPIVIVEPRRPTRSRIHPGRGDRNPINVNPKGATAAGDTESRNRTPPPSALRRHIDAPDVSIGESVGHPHAECSFRPAAPRSDWRSRWCGARYLTWSRVNDTPRCHLAGLC